MNTSNWEDRPELGGDVSREAAERGYWSGSSDYDPETVRFFDVAHEGAQVRVVSGATSALESLLFGATPRAVFLLPTDAVARACAQCVADQQTGVPVVVTQQLPAFVGALDTVVVLGERGSCDWASQALLTAARRGAQTVYLGPARGPLSEDARDAEGTLIIEALPTAEGTSPARYIAGLEAIFHAFHQPATVTTEYLVGLADELDQELETLSPERDAAVNPARALRNAVEGTHVIHTGGAVAQVAAALWAAGGLGGTYVEPELVPAVLERRAAESAGQGADRDDPFYDPFLDGPPMVLSRVLVWDDAPESPQGLAGVPSQDYPMASVEEPDSVEYSGSGASTTPPTYIAVTAPTAAAHPLQLLVRALAATAFHASEH